MPVSKEQFLPFEIDYYDKFVDLDKSVAIRGIMMDAFHGYDDSEEILRRETDVFCDDIEAALRASEEIRHGSPVIHVGNSGTLHRIVSGYIWANDLDAEVVPGMAFPDRQFAQREDVVGKTQAEVLELDNGTSQWATTLALLGDPERLDATDEPKLQLTYDFIDDWHRRRSIGQQWAAPRDNNLRTQYQTFLRILRGSEGLPPFEVDHSEHVCFAIGMGYMTIDEAREQFPRMADHETNRFEEMAEMMRQLEAGEAITSKDHRVIQVAAMLSKLYGRTVRFSHPAAVSKSAPQFWDFIISV